MAHHTRVRAPGLWTDFSVLLAAEMEEFDEDQYNSVNGDDGGTWAPSAAIIIGGSGMHVTGPLTADDLDGHVKTGKTLTIDNGGAFVTGSSATSTFNGPVNLANTIDVLGTALVKFESGAILQLKSGADLIGLSGSLLQMQSGSNITIAGSSTFSSGSSLAQNSGALWALSGTNTIESGAFITVKSGGTEDVEGTLNIKSGATFAVKSGAASTNASVLGVQFTGTAPAVNADPGADNIAIGLNQNKGWGSLLSDGGGGVSAPRGMNISSVAVSGSGAGWTILFVRPMDSNDYSITATHRLLVGTPAGPWFAQVEQQSSLGFTINIYKGTDGSAANVTADTFACGFQIEAQQ